MYFTGLGNTACLILFCFVSLMCRGEWWVRVLSNHNDIELGGSGVEWSEVVWCGVVWCGLMWCGVE